MSTASNVNPSARAALERYKMEASSELGINLKNCSKGSINRLGSTGSQMAKKIILAQENGLQ